MNHLKRDTRLSDQREYLQSSPAGSAADLTRFTTVPALQKKYFEVES